MDYKKLFIHIGLVGGAMFAFVCLIAFVVFNTFSWTQTGIFAIIMAVAFPVIYFIFGTGTAKNRAQIALAGDFLLAELIVIAAGGYYLFNHIIA